jgi:hypothetical protein
MRQEAACTMQHVACSLHIACINAMKAGYWVHGCNPARNLWSYDSWNSRCSQMFLILTEITPAHRRALCYNLWKRAEVSVIDITEKSLFYRSRRLRSLRRGSSAVRLLGLWFRIPSGTWMSVCECCVLSGRGPRRADLPSRGVVPTVFVCHLVWSSGTITLYTYNK